MTLFDQPRARISDPQTSLFAAESVKPANSELVRFIRQALERNGPMTHEGIVTEVMWVQPDRWTEGTIVTACARAGLHIWDHDYNARGNKVFVWSLEPNDTETVELTGDVL